jgi:hypothetical protein
MPDRPALRNNMGADVGVVGAGIAGSYNGGFTLCGMRSIQKQAAYRSYVIGAPIPKRIGGASSLLDTAEPFHLRAGAKAAEAHDPYRTPA